MRLHRFGCRGHALSVIQCVRGRSDRGRPCTGRCLSTRQLITAGREALVHEVVPVFDTLSIASSTSPFAAPNQPVLMTISSATPTFRDPPARNPNGAIRMRNWHRPRRKPSTFGVNSRPTGSCESAVCIGPPRGDPQLYACGLEIAVHHMKLAVRQRILSGSRQSPRPPWCTEVDWVVVD